MSCDWTRANITLYLYDELAASDRDRLEEHSETCESCTQTIERERRFLKTLSERPASAVPDSLLAECRHDLMRSVYRTERVPDGRGAGLLSWWRDVERGLTSLWRPAWQPAIAAVLLLTGFGLGRVFDPNATMGQDQAPQQASLIPASAAETMLAGIQSVAVDPEHGRIEIVVEEVTRRTISGQPKDPGIQRLLLSTVRTYPNSGVRLDTLDILMPWAQDPEVRSTLLDAMTEDENPGVRLKALEALRPHSDEPHVRQALVDVLRGDNNPGMRVQAIELLTENPSRDLVGVFQGVMDSEANNYVRLQCSRTLQELDASVERF